MGRKKDYKNLVFVHETVDNTIPSTNNNKTFVFNELQCCVPFAEYIKF